MLNEMRKPTGMRQAKPDKEDMFAARRLVIALDQANAGVVPGFVNSTANRFIENDADKVAAFDAILDVYVSHLPSSVSRCVRTLDLILDPESQVINPDSGIVELHPHIQRALEIVQLLHRINTGVNDHAIDRFHAVTKALSDASELCREMQTIESSAIRKGGE